MRGADLVYRSGKVHSEPPQSVKYSRELVLAPLELINRIAQRVPPPRTRRQSLLRRAGTEFATACGGDGEKRRMRRWRRQRWAAPWQRMRMPVLTRPSQQSESPSRLAGQVVWSRLSRQPNPNHARQRHYLWAALIARIYEVFPVLCPMCGGQMRIIIALAAT